MIRRFSAALIGLALCLPDLCGSAGRRAHERRPRVTVVDSYTDARRHDTSSGTVTNHTSARRSSDHRDRDCGKWRHRRQPRRRARSSTTWRRTRPASFSIDPRAAERRGQHGAHSVTAAGSITGTKPTGGIHVGAGEPSSATPARISLTNDSRAARLDGRPVVRRSVGRAPTSERRRSRATTSSVGSLRVRRIAIDFDADGTARSSTGIAARTTGAGRSARRWNNYFGDLGTLTRASSTEIAFLADEGITLGCGNSNFCPSAGVTRASDGSLPRSCASRSRMSRGPDRRLHRPDGVSRRMPSRHAINVLARQRHYRRLRDDARLRVLAELHREARRDVEVHRDRLRAGADPCRAGPDTFTDD